MIAAGSRQVAEQQRVTMGLRNSGAGLDGSAVLKTRPRHTLPRPDGALYAPRLRAAGLAAFGAFAAAFFTGPRCFQSPDCSKA